MAGMTNAAAGTTRRMAEIDAMDAPITGGAVRRVTLPPVPVEVSPASLGAVRGVVAPMAPPPAMGFGSAVRRMFGFGAKTKGE